MVLIHRARLAAPLLSTVLLLGCGEDTTAPSEAVATTVFISNGALTLSLVGETIQLDVSILDQNGSSIPNASTTFLSSSVSVATVNSTGLVTAVGSGNAEITVQSGAAIGTVPLDVILAPLVLEEGVAITLSGSTASQQFFTFEVPDGPPNRVLEVSIQSGTGDADVAVRFGAPPDSGTFDCASGDAATFPQNLDFCALHGPAAGTWHVLVLGFDAFSGLELRAQIVTPTVLESGVPLTGISGGTAEARYFTLEVPTPAGALRGSATTLGSLASPSRSGVFSLGPDLGAKARKIQEWDWSDKPGVDAPLGPGLAGNAFTDGTLTIDTEGGTGDSDLFGGRSAIASLDGLGSYPCISFQVGTGDSCSITDPDAGLWNILMLGFEAFSDVSLTATFTPPAQGNAASAPSTPSRR